MATIHLKANLLELNQYDFDIEVNDGISDDEQRDIAIKKLKAFLSINNANPFQHYPVDGVMCCDRLSAIETFELKTII